MASIRQLAPPHLYSPQAWRVAAASQVALSEAWRARQTPGRPSDRLPRAGSSLLLPQDVLVQTGAGCGHQEPQVDPSITLLRRLAITLRDRAIRTVAAQAQDRRRTWLTCWLVEELPQGRLIELKHGERDRKSTRLNSSHYCASRIPS